MRVMAGWLTPVASTAADTLSGPLASSAAIDLAQLLAPDAQNA